MSTTSIPPKTEEEKGDNDSEPANMKIKYI